MNYEDILAFPPYGIRKENKVEIMTSYLKNLSLYHAESSPEYKNIVENIWGGKKGIEQAASYYDLPFLPVALFKHKELRSVPKEEVVKTMTSSGTTGQQVSKIFLDRNTAANQQKTLAKIVTDFTGGKRMPMIILDCPSVIKDRAMFSARGAGILGFSIFGSKKMYAFNDNMELNLPEIKAFLEEHKGEEILLFGFTFMIWQHFYKALEGVGEFIDLSKGILIHGGGWKKLLHEAVSKEEFKKRLHDVCGIKRVHDYYGMVEQTGCIYMECECGHLHASTFSDVIVRRMKDFSVCEVGESGVIQVLSLLPESYPGHSILTEDEGKILGEDDCPCGRKGKYFTITGRIKQAQVRGCSDTYEQR
ncbi:MAG: hypothetical protein PWP24_1653 [Clostridiales bacterium]|nr:hypothetical protein [Clostridiales bacterium]